MSTRSNQYVPMLATFIPDWALEALYEQLEKENSLRWLFHDNEVSSKYDFVSLARQKTVLFYVVIDSVKDAIVAVFWLNGRTAVNATLHMVFMKQYWGHSIEVGKEMLNWIFVNVPHLQSLISFIPDDNRLAQKYASNTGWKNLGSIPYLMQNTSGSLFYITKEMTNGG